MLNEMANEQLHSPLRVTHVGDCDGGSGFGMVVSTSTSWNQFLSLASLLFVMWFTTMHSLNQASPSFGSSLDNPENQRKKKTLGCFQKPTQLFVDSPRHVSLHHIQKHSTTLNTWVLSAISRNGHLTIKCPTTLVCPLASLYQIKEATWQPLVGLERVVYTYTSYAYIHHNILYYIYIHITLIHIKIYK